jgi:hypothetical protein
MRPNPVEAIVHLNNNFLRKKVKENVQNFLAMHNIRVKNNSENRKGYFIARFNHCFRKLNFI